MLLYIAVLFFLISIHFINIKNQYTNLIVFVLLGIFLCMGYMTGSDWRSYEQMYVTLDLNSLNYDGRVEYGYYLYMVLGKKLGLSFWAFFIITKFIIWGIFFQFLKKYSSREFYLNLAIFVAFFGLYLFIDNPMRNLIGATIYLYSYKFILKRKFYSYAIICIIASLFHLSFLLFIPFYFILNRSFDVKKVVWLYIGLNIFLLLFSEQLILIFQGLDIFAMQFYGRFQEQVSKYVLDETLKDNPLAIGLLIKHVIFIIVLYNKNKIVKFNKYGNIIFNTTIITLFLMRFIYIWPIILRLIVPFSILYCVSFGAIIKNSKRYKYNRYAYYVIFVVLMYGTMLNTVTGSYKYIPYTNHLSYIMEKPIPYSIRSNYNLKNSPYN